MAQSKQSRVQRKYGSRRWRWTAWMAKRAAGWRCQRCQQLGAQLEAHHIVPVLQGGSWWDLDNIEVLCRGCHIAHHHPKTLETQKWDDFIRG